MAGPLPVGEAWPANNSIPFVNSDSSFHAYVHVPFCEVRCGYCDFNTYTAIELGEVKQAEFHHALISEIEFSKKVLDSNSYKSKSLSSIFFGGGTPTRFDSVQIASIIEALRTNFGVQSDVEITTESNPDSVNPIKVEQIAEIGVNRISFGVQSFDKEVLKVLDRTHNPDRVAEVVRAAKANGLRVSIDLIFGTPGETVSSWERTLNQALDLGVEHVSAYALIVEPGTALERKIRSGEIAPVDEDSLAEKYELASTRFEEAGLRWYEISNWGVPSRHNLAYWESQDWWGYGPGAHSHISGVRWWNRKHPTAYLASLSKAAPAQGLERLSPRTILEEKVMLGLRTETGVSRSVLQNLGVSRQVVAELLASGKLELTPNSGVRVSKPARFLADGLVLELVSSIEA